MSDSCRHLDIRKFDGIRTCLACGTTTFEANRSKTPREPASQAVSSPPHSYEYSRLNYELGQEIRLVIIQPGTADDPIFCRLVTVNLEDNPEYDALSYTWATQYGNTELSKSAYCVDGSVLKLTINCEAALRRLRSFGVRKVWIDALCIDQNHLAERNHQVNLMEKIYRGATRVFVYLDTAGCDFTLLFDYLNERGDHEGSEVDQRIQARGLLRLRWFSRVWVIQEVTLARSALLLTDQHHAILDAVTVSRLESMSEMSVSGPLHWITRGKHQERPDLLQCVLATEECVATDTRDKIFAILSLLDHQARAMIPVDYSVEQISVYINVAIVIMMQRKDLEFLRYSYGLDDQDEFFKLSSGDWPSWVPPWHGARLSAGGQLTREPTGPWKHQVDRATLEFWSQNLEIYSRERSEPLPRRLRVEAHLLDMIESDEWTGRIGARTYAYHSSTYWNSFETREEPAVHQETFSHSPAEVLDLDSACHEEILLKLLNLHTVKFRSSAKNLLNQKEEFFRNAEPYDRFLKAASKAPNGLKMFRTTHSLGFSRYRPSKGDVICAINGLQTPVILRPQKENHYQFVCDCNLMAALDYGTWKASGGRGPWGELPDDGVMESKTIFLR